MISNLLNQINQVNTLLANGTPVELEEREKVFFNVLKIIKDSKNLNKSDPEIGELRGALKLLHKNLKEFKGDASNHAEDIDRIVQKYFKPLKKIR